MYEVIKTNKLEKTLQQIFKSKLKSLNRSIYRDQWENPNVVTPRQY